MQFFNAKVEHRLNHIVKYETLKMRCIAPNKENKTDNFPYEYLL